MSAQFLLRPDSSLQRRLICRLVLALGLAVAVAAAVPNSLRAEEMPPGFTGLKIGDTAPDFSLMGTDGKKHALKEFSNGQVLMVIFASNHCPTSHAIEKRLLTLLASVEGKGVEVVAINPNHPSGMTPQEHSYGVFTDSFEDMKPYAESVGWKFPYLYDGDTQTVAKAYGCLATPHVFLFDKALKLRYAGRYDDSRVPDPATVKSPDTKNALEAMLAGKPVPVEITKPHGCATKWREKATMVADDQVKWEKLPVVLDLLDKEGAEKLRKNGSGKFRLVNFWATWCGPCVEEFPAFVRLQREVSLRNFEFVSVSLDDPKDQPSVNAFLEKNHAVVPARIQKMVESEGRKTNHYLFTGGLDELMTAMDPEWPGPIPHTILLSPEGKLLFRHNGKITAAELKKKVIEAMGPYWETPNN